MLRSVAKRLTTCVRESDTVSRHGGDEFLILLSEVDQPEDAGLIAEKIVASIAEPHLIAGHELTLTASVGIALYPEDGQDAQSLIMRADTAMYHAKNTGRNRVGFYRARHGGARGQALVDRVRAAQRARQGRARAVLPADDRSRDRRRSAAPRR